MPVPGDWVITCCCAWALLLAVSRLGFQGVMTVPDSCGSLRCGTRTYTQGKCIVNFNFRLQSDRIAPHLHGLHSEGRGALLEHEDPLGTEPPGLEWPAPIMQRPSSCSVSWPKLARAELRSKMCCFCLAVSLGWGQGQRRPLLGLLPISRNLASLTDPNSLKHAIS